MRGNSLRGMAASAPTELTHAMPVATTEDFATVLRGWRTRRRLSQLDLAIEAGTTQRHVSFLERGRSLPGRDSLPALRIRFS
jgi:predicted transcriptional regulator